MIKKKPIINKLKQVVAIQGSKDAAALSLNIHARYIDMILKGTLPGPKVYKLIDEILGT